MTQFNKDFELHIYEGAKHGFFNDTNTPVYQPAAAFDTWPRLIDFFRQHLSANSA